MEEHQFFLKMCSELVGSNKHIVFAGVVDYEGKLLTGTEGNSKLVSGLENNLNLIIWNLPFVLLSHIMDGIKDIISSLDSSSNHNNFPLIPIIIFELDQTAIIIAPLTCHGKTFLSILVEIDYLNECIMSKIIENSGEEYN